MNESRVKLKIYNIITGDYSKLKCIERDKVNMFIFINIKI
jgi:hypothetical protein